MKMMQFLLLKLMEECAEVQQRASKMIQFGADETEPGQPFTNTERLREELNDLIATIHIIEQNGFPPFPPAEFNEIVSKKASKILKFLVYSKDIGALKIEPDSEN